MEVDIVIVNWTYGIENVNSIVRDFLITTDVDIRHLIAQRDIPFSNSKIEAFNKIIKH